MTTCKRWRARSSALFGPFNRLLEQASTFGRSREEQKNARIIRREPSERLVLARGLLKPAVRSQKIPEPSPGHRIVRRELDDLPEGSLRLKLIRRFLLLARGAFCEAKIELSDGCADLRVRIRFRP